MRDILEIKDKKIIFPFIKESRVACYGAIQVIARNLKYPLLCQYLTILIIFGNH